MLSIIREVNKNSGNKYKNKSECSLIPLTASVNLYKLLYLIINNDFKALEKYLKIIIMWLNTINISNSNKLKVECNLNLNPSSVDCGGL